jgi:hypothetical protein
VLIVRKRCVNCSENMVFIVQETRRYLYRKQGLCIDYCLEYEFSTENTVKENQKKYSINR